MHASPHRSTLTKAYPRSSLVVLDGLLGLELVLDLVVEREPQRNLDSNPSRVLELKALPVALGGSEIRKLGGTLGGLVVCLGALVV